VALQDTPLSGEARHNRPLGPAHRLAHRRGSPAGPAMPV